MKLRYRLRASRMASLTIMGLGLALPLGGLLSAQSTVDLPVADRPLTPATEDLFTVGSIAGDAWETFGESVRVAFGPEGSLYILDADNSRVVVVGREGEFLREFGQAGGGPGEFRMPMGIAVTPDGELVVSDIGQRGLLVFSIEGEYLRTVPVDLARGAPGPDFVADPAGGAILSPPGGIRISMRGPGGEVDSGSSLLIQRFGLGEDGNPETVYSAWEPPPAGEGEGGTIDMGGGRSVQLSSMTKLRAFEPEVLFGVMPDGGLVVADSVTYSLEILSRDGRPRLTLRRPIDPVPVTPAIRAAEKQRRLDELDEGTGPRMTMITSGGGGGSASRATSDGISEMMRGRIEEMEFMDEVPVLADLGVDHAGRIWVRRTGERPGEDGPIDILSPTGEYLGTVSADLLEIPAAFGPEGLAAFIRRDELDVVTVQVRQVGF